MIKEAINLVVQNISLSEAEMAECMTEIMEGRATGSQIGAFLTALRIKGETVEEITGAARIMREKATKIVAPEGIVDTCGTGGDLSNTFNISTTAAIVVAASGVPVAKHGNRSVSSQSGSADLLDALGVKVDLQPEKVEKCLFETNFGFLFAPLFHPAMKFAVGPRREIGIRTIFNILGPITNPASATRQLIGVFAGKMTEPLAFVLGKLGAEDVMVVHGEDGLDEISTCGATKVSRYRNKTVENFYITPEDYGFKLADITDLTGGDKTKNAALTLSVLNDIHSPKRDIVVLNAAAAIVVSGRADNFAAAKEIAEETLLNGKAAKKLEEIVRVTNKL
jgi:anthranilate phosphoribosyltransferase